MLLGIDVGGTHTDAVIIGGQGLLAQAKVVTDHDNLLASIHSAMETVLAGVEADRVRTMNLSTTLATNAIVEGKSEEVGTIVSAGPGIDPEHQRIGRYYYIVDGSIDHRGRVIKELDTGRLGQIIEDCRQAGISVFAAVSKFSTRNPDHEQAMSAGLSGRSDFITLGHRLSGRLNFPRRVATSYFNSAVWRLYRDFAQAVEESAAGYGLSAEINILKADGGTMPLAAARAVPVESILSGPAASIMGIIALCDVREDSIILDIGGTTTDMAVFAEGAPVMEKDGMTVGSYPTLVRALQVKSIGIGGDSALHFNNGRVTVGPDRQGPPLANGGSIQAPALTDAMNYMHLTDFGDRLASVAGLEKLAGQWGMQPDDLAGQAVDFAVGRIRDAAWELVELINEKPVYTIHELLRGKQVKPQKAFVMGGPAQALGGRLARSLQLEVTVPEYFAVANAVGAALTRTTMEVELSADTERGRLMIPNLNINKKITQSYDLPQARADVEKYLREHLKRLGVGHEDLRLEITEEESFHMVEGPDAVGRIIRVKCQIRPGVLAGRQIHEPGTAAVVFPPPARST